MRIHSRGLALLLLLTACVPTPPPSDSGITGTVTIGPMCPVVQVNNPCPDQPYQATLTIFSADGKKITRFETDANGRFRVALAAGDYVLHPESPNALPYAADMPFTVTEHQFTRVDVSYDSGIR